MPSEAVYTSLAPQKLVLYKFVLVVPYNVCEFTSIVVIDPSKGVISVSIFTHPDVLGRANVVICILPVGPTLPV